MSKTSVMTIRIDSELKEQAESLCAEMGLSLSAVYKLLLKAIVNTRSLPFKIKAADPFYSTKNQEYLMKSIEELDAGLGKEHDLIDA